MSASITSQTRSAGPYVASLVLHGAVVLAVALTAMVFQQAQRNTSQIFELVAGEGADYAATEAPAPGITFEQPEAPIVAPPFQPPAPEPPPAPAPPPPVVQPPVVQPAPPAPAPPPAVAPPVKPEEKPRQATVSWQQFQQQNKDRMRARSAGAPPPAGARPKPAVVPKIKLPGPGAPGGAGGAAGAGGNVLSRAADQNLLDGYLAMLQRQLKAAHEKPAGLGEHLSVTISFTLSASGAMGDVRVVRSSGSAEFDQSALAAFRAVRSIGERPDGKTDTRTAVFKMSEE